MSVQAQQDRLRRKRREAGEVLTIFRKPLKESLTSVLPITAIVLVLCFTITPISNNAMMAFLLGSLLLIVGLSLIHIFSAGMPSPVLAEMDTASSSWLRSPEKATSHLLYTRMQGI